MRPPSDVKNRTSRPVPPGTIRLGQVAGVDVTVANSWFLIVGLIAILMAPRIEEIAPDIGAGAYVAGVAYAVLLYASVLLHEMSHALAALSFKMQVNSINLHFLGGATEIEGEATTPWREFVIAVVGPLTSLAVGGIAWLAADSLPSGSLLEFSIKSLALANIIVGVFNLVPGLPLDGGRILQSLVWAVSGQRSTAVVVAAWGGRVAACGVFAYPVLIVPALGGRATVLGYLVSFMIAVFLWTGASHALMVTRVRGKLPMLQARSLARPAIGVPAELPLAEAIRRAQEANAGSLVVMTTEGKPAGIVNESAVLSTPEARRPWLPSGDLARRLEDGLVLSADLGGEPLLQAMNRTPATEYVLVEADGSIYGVLVTKDVDKAFRAA